MKSSANVAISQAGLGNRVPSLNYGGAMRDRTRREIEQWWRDVFDVRDALWSKVTVQHPHGLLGDYAGWFVAWRDAGVHVSAPSSADADEVASLTNESAVILQDVTFWQAFANQRGLELIGPGVHRYLDEDPGPARGVREVAASELRALGEQVEVDDWWECGFDESLDEPGVVAFAAEGGGAVLSGARWGAAQRHLARGARVARSRSGHRARAGGGVVRRAPSRLRTLAQPRHQHRVDTCRAAARIRELRDAARGQAGEWIVTGLNDGRCASNAAMSSSCPRVIPTSSSPSSNRHRV